MSSEQMMYRIFTCPRCNYTGYRQVSEKEEDSTCNLCSTLISHTSQMEYVRNVDEAIRVIQRIVLRSQTRTKPKSRLGIGVKKRILYMVSDLSNINHGGGVSLERLLQECTDADIDLGKAQRFLKQLEEEGLIMDIDGQLVSLENKV